MTSAPSADEVAALQTRLTNELTTLIQTLTAGAEYVETASRIEKLERLRERVVNEGPSAYTVTKVARRTGVPTADYLHMTAANYWRWQRPPLAYSAASHTLEAHHIFDTFALQQIGGSSEVVQVLQGVRLAEALAAEAVMTNNHVAAIPAFSAIEQWVKIMRIVDIRDMRGVEGIRQSMRLENQGTQPSPDPMRDLGRAESIALALRYAQDGEPSRIVTGSPKAAKPYKSYGLAATTVWDLFAEAADENRLSTDAIRTLRGYRQEHDPNFELRTNSWPRNTSSPPSRDRPRGQTRN